MDFDFILGQEKLIENLKKVLEKKELVHAYLLEGQKGLGKKRVAYLFAKGICCRGQGQRPCNKCISCRKMEGGNHPEIMWIQGEGSIKIDQIRQLQKNLQLMPYEGDQKVCIICHADEMTVQAQNALLKTLEEPPKHAVLILLTARPDSLLPTIVSRCQRIKMSPITREEIEKYLINKKGLEENEARVIGSLSKGIIGEALRLLEDEDFKRQRKETIRITRDLIDKNTIEVLENIHFFIEERPHINEILDMLIIWYRDLLIYKDTNVWTYIINIDQGEDILYQSKKLSFDSIKEMFLIINKTRENFMTNVNFQLSLENMLLELKEKTK